MVSLSVYLGAIAFVISIVCIPANNGWSLPPNMSPCQGLDRECLTKKANEYLKDFAKGIKELDVPPADPFTLDKMDVDLGGLKIKLKDIVVTGLSQCDVEKLDMPLAEHKIYIDLNCNVTVKAKYRTKGKLLLLDLEGDGDLKVKIKKLAIKVELDFVFEKRNGDNYLKINKGYKHTSKVHGFAHFDLSNLFGGNKILGTPVLTFINQNWEQLYNEFSGPIVDQSIGLAVGNINKFFSQVPRSVLAPGFDEIYKGQE